MSHGLKGLAEGKSREAAERKARYYTDDGTWQRAGEPYCSRCPAVEPDRPEMRTRRMTWGMLDLAIGRGERKLVGAAAALRKLEEAPNRFLGIGDVLAGYSTALKDARRKLRELQTRMQAVQRTGREVTDEIARQSAGFDRAMDDLEAARQRLPAKVRSQLGSASLSAPRPARPATWNEIVFPVQTNSNGTPLPAASRLSGSTAPIRKPRPQIGQHTPSRHHPKANLDGK